MLSCLNAVVNLHTENVPDIKGTKLWLLFSLFLFDKSHMRSNLLHKIWKTFIQIGIPENKGPGLWKILEDLWPYSRGHMTFEGPEHSRTRSILLQRLKNWPSILTLLWSRWIHIYTINLFRHKKFTCLLIWYETRCHQDKYSLKNIALDSPNSHVIISASFYGDRDN